MTYDLPVKPEEQNKVIKALIDSAVETINQEVLARYNDENPDKSLGNLTAERLSTIDDLDENDPIKAYLLDDHAELLSSGDELRELTKQLEDGTLDEEDGFFKVEAIISAMIGKLGENKDFFKELREIIRAKHKVYMSYPDVRIKEALYKEDDMSERALGIDLNQSMSRDIIIIHLDNNGEKISVGVADIQVHKAENFAKRKVITKTQDGVSIDTSDVLFDKNPQYVINIGCIYISDDFRNNKKGIHLLNLLIDVVKVSIEGIKDTVDGEVLVVLEQAGIELEYSTRIKDLATLYKGSYTSKDHEIYTVEEIIPEEIDKIPDDLNIVHEKSFSEGDLLCSIYYINEGGHNIPAYETKTDEKGNVVEMLRYISPINRLDWGGGETADAVAERLDLTEVNGVYHLVDLGLNPERIFTSTLKVTSQLIES